MKRPSNRVIDLCERLISSGSIHGKLSASELHEIVDYVLGQVEDGEYSNEEDTNRDIQEG